MREPFARIVTLFKKHVLACIMLLACHTSLLAAEFKEDATGPVKVTRIEDPSALALPPGTAQDAAVCHFDQQLTAKEGEAIVRRIAREEHFNVELAVAIARQESGFRMGAVSSAGAIGLMQLMPTTARRLAVNICDPEDNTRGAIRYLKVLEKKYANPLYMLAAYNAGEPAVEQNQGIPLYPETIRYVSAILSDLYNWQPFNASPVSVANVNRQQKTVSKKPNKDSPFTWAQGFVLHME